MFWSAESIRLTSALVRRLASSEPMNSRCWRILTFSTVSTGQIVEMQARLGDLVLRLAEHEFLAELVRLDGVDRLDEPEGADDDERDQPDGAVAAHAPGSMPRRRSWLRRSNSSRSGGCGPAALRSGTPGASAAALPSPTTRIVAPGHQDSSCRFVRTRLSGAVIEERVETINAKRAGECGRREGGYPLARMRTSSGVGPIRRGVRRARTGLRPCRLPLPAAAPARFRTIPARKSQEIGCHRSPRLRCG